MALKSHDFHSGNIIVLDCVTLLHSLTQPEFNFLLNPSDRFFSDLYGLRELVFLDVQIESGPREASQFTHMGKSQYFHALHLDVVSYKAFALTKSITIHKDFFPADLSSLAGVAITPMIAPSVRITSGQGLATGGP